ncbi:M15 family metallopeptidase [Phytoactinopolyspora halotolerans]|uniref:M15 family metallopeptidase n=2 Tax=Phytoactinopolyspora halotolerans TaxID=1981512 RepID=A0A6L9SIB0_9ACTN|nr:M15 family metallopeptidase [Phytoactinopolyspora halotolerans]
MVVGGAVVIGALVYHSLESSPSSGASPGTDTADPDPAVPDTADPDTAGSDTSSTAADGDRRPPHPPGGDQGAHGDRDVADGAVPDGVTAFDDEYPGVANLNADLLAALRRAAADAADDGVEIFVNSGWRSPAYQEQLLQEAVSTYGSESEAARWVATADTSAHVSGDAVDVGRSDATEWLSEHGAAYGLCQIYRNEPWHYELRPEAIDDGCPRMYADPTQDPRMQR